MPRSHRLVATVALATLLLTGCTTKPTPITEAELAEVVIPFTLTEHNVIVVRVVLNDVDALNLMLHTAATDVTLTEEAVRKATSIAWTDTSKMKAWGGEADSRFSKGNQIRIGDLHRGDVTVWENKNSGHDTDGKFGLDSFESRIVELDFDLRRIVLHDRLPHKVGQYDRIKVENRDGQLLVPGGCRIDGTTNTTQFLLHSGYSGGLLLDDAFAAKTGVDGKIRITDESSLKDSFGHTIRVKKGILPAFVLGRSELADVPVGFFAGAIGAQKMSVLGCGVLRQFNFILDRSNGDLYLVRRTAP